MSACARNGACPAVEVGGRVSFHPVCFSGLSVHRTGFFYLSSSHVRLSVRRPVAEQNMDLNVKSKKTVADKVVLFEQKRPGLVMFLRGRNRAEKRRRRGSSLALHEYYSNERCCYCCCCCCCCCCVAVAGFSPLSFRFDSNAPPSVSGILSFLPLFLPLLLPPYSIEAETSKLRFNWVSGAIRSEKIARVTRTLGAGKVTMPIVAGRAVARTRFHPGTFRFLSRLKKTRVLTMVNLLLYQFITCDE